MKPESQVLAETQLEASRLGWRIFRNQVGKYRLADGRWLSSGLCVGSSDLIGFRPIVITPEMVGQTIAQFVAVECKSERGIASPEQKAFLEYVKKSGGVAILARSARDILYPKLLIFSAWAC